MLFPTLDYLLFLLATVAVLWAVPRRHRLAVLGVSSLLFYASWRLAYLPVLLGVAAVAWLGGLWLERVRAARGPDGARPHQVAVLVVLLLPLLFFKYWDWLAGDFERAVRWLGVPLDLPEVGLALPIGISFFTFQALAYVVDVRREGGAERNPFRFGVFVVYFPQLVAGPIVRRGELLPQLRELPALAAGDVGAGIYRILVGLAKKLLVADVLRVAIVDPVFAEPGQFTGPELLLGLYAYTLQIYCDFSGYTDMAVGSARLMGIRLPENFRRPYKAASVGEFWRRWHVTLSNWVRDYIYYPLGGARMPRDWQVYRNIVVTLLVIGVWHGASWNFVVYGLMHGVAVSVNRWRRRRTGRRPFDPFPHWWMYAWRWVVTFHYVVLARILFRAPDFATAGAYARGLLRWEWVLPRFSPTALAILAAGFALHFTPDDWRDRLGDRFVRLGPLPWALAAAAVGLAVLRLGTGEVLSFVYYAF